MDRLGGGGSVTHTMRGAAAEWHWVLLASLNATAKGNREGLYAAHVASQPIMIPLHAAQRFLMGLP